MNKNQPYISYAKAKSLRAREFCFLSFLFLFFCTIVNAQEKKQITNANQLDAGFKNPPVSARPKALWPWVNGNVSLSQITYELEEAKRKGMGGFDIWDIGISVDPNHVVPAGPAFLSDESVQAIAYTLREANRIGLEIGLTFSSSWNAGGSWVKPEHGAMGLFRKDTIVSGPSDFSGALPFPFIPGTYGDGKTILHLDKKTGLPTYNKEVALLAHPLQKDSTIASSKEVISLQPFLNNQGELKWKVPAGVWRIIRYVCTPTGQPLAIPSANSKGLMLDHFSAAAQKANMDYIFSRLLPATGSLKNSSLKYLYADSYEVNSAVWTPLLPEEFLKRNGYSLINYLPILDGFKFAKANTDNRFLIDFRKTLSDLIIQNHYELGRKICEQHGIGFCAEAGGPGQPIHNVPFEDLKALGALTIPRGEFWNKHPQLNLLQIIKGISSASHIYNQKFVEAESFTSVWLWQEGPDELKPLADRAMCEGLNRFVYHTFPHTPPESGDPGWVYNFGTLINTTNGWWPKSESFHEYLARCSYLLQQGNFVGDVAFYYGDDAPNFVPYKQMPASLGFGYDYDVVNTDVLLNKMYVKNGRIYLPHGQYYEVLVLPAEQTMNEEVAKKLQQMVAAGATIIGGKPNRSYGLHNANKKDELIQSIAKTLWVENATAKEHNYGKGKVIWGKTIREVLVQKGVGPDVQLNSSNPKDSIDFIHRKTAKADIYFIRNTKPDSLNTSLTFRIKGLTPEIWDPVTGNIISAIAWKKTKEGIEIPVSFADYGSCFVVFKPMVNVPFIADLKLNDKDWKIANASINYTTNGIATTTSGKWSWNKNGSHFSKVVALPGSIDLNGPWELRFQEPESTLARDTFNTLMPLNRSEKESIKYFSGTVAYHHSFSLTSGQINKDQRILLNLGRVKEIAEVFFLTGKTLVNIGMPLSRLILRTQRRSEKTN